MTKKKAAKKSSKKIIKAKVDKIVTDVQEPKMVKVKAVVVGNAFAIGQTVPGTEIEISEQVLAELRQAQLKFEAAIVLVEKKIKEAQLAN